MKPSEIAHLGPKARAQLEAALAADPLPARRARSGKVARASDTDAFLFACATAGCDFPLTSTLAAMERHCDEMKHHRYRVVL